MDDAIIKKTAASMEPKPEEGTPERMMELLSKVARK
jgi:hypothetical protein